MNKQSFGIRVAVTAFLLAAGAAQAQGTAHTKASAASEVAGVKVQAHKLERADVAFLKQAAQNGHAEIEGSKLALSKGTHAQVKAFAQQMVDDHTKASQELSALATDKGVELPSEPSLAQKAKLKLLAQRDGESFDRHYAESVGVAAHEDTVKLFKKAAAQAKDADVKAFATKTLPTLEQHLQHARDLKAATDKKS
ncbi:MAG: DUF4142 domain-containing protein [Rubrivivax sp.]|nr:MAG: DUF4142 domain-containing protein [Rubrivivax sp.]